MARWLAASVAVGCISLFSPVQAGNLDWGRPNHVNPAGFSESGNPLRASHSDTVLPSESDVIAAAWEADDTLAAELEEPLAEAEPALESAKSGFDNSATENPLHTVDPFEADNRIAQLVKDPFEEPLEGPIPSLDTDLDDIEESLDRERQRREEEAEEEPEVMDDTSEVENFDEIVLPDQDESTQVREGGRSEFNFELKVPETELKTTRPSQFRDNRFETGRLIEDQQNCEEELAAAKADRVSSVDLDINIEGIPGEDYPFECAFGNEPLTPRSWPEITYNWRASALCHKPLYFEQDQLERYGHSWGPYLQPIMSGVHFFTSVPILPYKMGIESPNECIYALGHYRPGDCAPYMIEPIPFTWRAAFYQAGFVTGTAFAIP